MRAYLSIELVALKNQFIYRMKLCLMIDSNNLKQMVIVVLEEKEICTLIFLLSACCMGYDLLKYLQEFH